MTSCFTLSLSTGSCLIYTHCPVTPESLFRKPRMTLPTDSPDSMTDVSSNARNFMNSLLWRDMIRTFLTRIPHPERRSNSSNIYSIPDENCVRAVTSRSDLILMLKSLRRQRFETKGSTAFERFNHFLSDFGDDESDCFWKSLQDNRWRRNENESDGEMQSQNENTIEALVLNLINYSSSCLLVFDATICKERNAIVHVDHKVLSL